MYEKFKDKGLEIIGFPCNQVCFFDKQPSATSSLLTVLLRPIPPLEQYQFGGQEPGSDEDVAAFCELNHGVTFPVCSILFQAKDLFLMVKRKMDALPNNSL